MPNRLERNRVGQCPVCGHDVYQEVLIIPTMGPEEIVRPHPAKCSNDWQHDLGDRPGS